MPERYISPALRDLDGMSLQIAPLVGVEANIYNDLWNAVLDRELRPGTKLEEASLCEIYKVSRTVIRKVLVIMEQEGIVSLPLNRGAFVASPTFRDAHELIEAVSIVVSEVAASLAAQKDRLTKEQKAKLKAHVDAARKAAEEGDLHNERRFYIEFLLLLMLIYGNRVMAGTLERQSIRFAIAVSSYQEGHVAESGPVHFQKVVDAILAGDSDEAARLVFDHLQAIRRSLRAPNESAMPDLRSILGKRRAAA